MIKYALLSCKFGPLAHLVERSPDKTEVHGSKPWRPTDYSRIAQISSLLLFPPSTKLDKSLIYFKNSQE
jgi:hypothetical protein